MHRPLRMQRSIVWALIGVVLTSALAVAGPGQPGDAIEKTVPEPTETIDLYEGSLDPNNPLTGTLADPADPFDWWCLNVQSGTVLTITVNGNTGSRPNCGIVQGIGADGDAFQTLGPIVAATNNGTAESATLTLTPTFTGPATVWISNAGTGFSISYTVSMSGGTVNQSCNPCPDCPVNVDVDFNEQVRFVVGPQRNAGGGIIEVPLLVDCGEVVRFTKMTVEFDNTCLTFVDAAFGSSVSNPGGIFFSETAGSVLARSVTVLGTGDYGPICRAEVFVLRFMLASPVPPASCALVLDRTTGISNPPNHVLVDLDNDGTTDRLLEGNANSFCDGVVEIVDIALAKIASNPTPNVGDAVVFTVTVTNNGPDLASNVVVNDVVPSGVTLQTFSVTQGTYTSATGVWDVGSLANGGSATLMLNTTVDTGTASTTITNTATLVSLDQADTNGANDSASAQIDVLGIDLAVTKSVDVPAPNPGDTVTFTVTCTNNGPDTGTNITVLDALPTGVTHVSNTPATGTTYTPATGVWSIPSLASGASVNLTLVATVDTGTQGTTITNTATFTSADQTDTNSGNDTGSASIMVPAIDIAVTKTVDVPNPNPGDTVTFTVTAMNNGPDTATNVVITDLLPSGVTHVSNTPATGTTYTLATGAWDIPSLANGTSVTLTLVATVDAGTATNTITNTATFTSATETDTNSGNDTATATITVKGIDIALTKTVDVPTPNEGDTVTFTVTAMNNGPDTATNVVVTDLLPTGVTHVSNTPATGTTYTLATGAWSIPSLANGSSVTLALVATVNMGTVGMTITNTAAFTSATETDINSGNDSASASITVKAIDIALNKTVDVPNPNPGDTVTFTVTATNNGPDTATNVVVTDLLPTGVTHVSNTPATGTTYTLATGAWSIPSLASGASVTLTLVATVDAGTATNTITNTATFTSATETDTNSGNDTATASITVKGIDIALTKTVDVPNPNPGDTVTFTVTATNNGPDTATNVVVTDLLPTGVTHVSNTPATGTTYTLATGAWSIPSLANGASVTLTLVATVDAGTAGNTLTNTATFTSATETDTSSGNDTASASIMVKAIDIALTKTVDVPNPNIGDTVTFTVTATNNGPNTATNVVVTDMLPVGVTHVSNTPATGTTYTLATGVWSIPSLANGASVTLTLVATVDAGTVGLTITNTATLTSATETDIDSGNDADSASITPTGIDLALTKTVDNPTPNPGDTVTFTVTCTNNGPGTATNVTITDQLPAGVSHVSNTPSTGTTYTLATGVWSIPSLANGASVTLMLVATVDAGTEGTTIINTASVTGADQTDVNSGNDTASASITVGCPNVDFSGTVTYYANGTPILPAVPDASSVAVTVKDANNAANSTQATAGSYTLPFGNGPHAQICITAERPKVANCNNAEAGVISGNDLIILEDFIANIGTPTAEQRIAGDANGDQLLAVNDALSIRQWIGKAGPCLGNTCVGLSTDNCVGTWRFIFPRTGGFATDSICVDNVCVDQTVNVQGILIGDVDHSWPNILLNRPGGSGPPAKPSVVDLALGIESWEDDVVTLVLRADVDAGEALHHVIYSLDYDADAFTYLGMEKGAAIRDWGEFDNPAEPGVTHGIVHRRGGKEPLKQSGEILRFRFKAASPAAIPNFSFSRLKANDLDVGDVEVTGDPLPTRFALGNYPNPFNPSTRVRLAIPAGAGNVAVTLRIYDIAGRLVRVLAEERWGPGFHDVQWNGQDSQGRPVGTGIYFVRARAGSWSEVKKVTLIR